MRDTPTSTTNDLLISRAFGRVRYNSQISILGTAFSAEEEQGDAALCFAWSRGGGPGVPSIRHRGHQIIDCITLPPAKPTPTKQAPAPAVSIAHSPGSEKPEHRQIEASLPPRPSPSSACLLHPLFSHRDYAVEVHHHAVNRARSRASEHAESGTVTYPSFPLSQSPSHPKPNPLLPHQPAREGSISHS